MRPRDSYTVAVSLFVKTEVVLGKCYSRSSEICWVMAKDLTSPPPSQAGEGGCGLGTHNKLTPVHEKRLLALLDCSRADAMDGQSRLHAICGKVIRVACCHATVLRSIYETVPPLCQWL